jgi:hypothetical protein
MLTSSEMVVSGAQWPIFLYDGYEYDPEDPRKGLFKSNILIYVSTPPIRAEPFRTDFSGFKAFKHVFTSPSSVNKAPTATQSGNARIHGMTSVTPASISYIATQVRHACYLYLYYAELIAPGRFNLPLALHPSSAKWTQLLTLNDSTTAYWSALRTLTSNNKSGSS